MKYLQQRLMGPKHGHPEQAQAFTLPKPEGWLGTHTPGIFPWPWAPVSVYFDPFRPGSYIPRACPVSHPHAASSLCWFGKSGKVRELLNLLVVYSRALLSVTCSISLHERCSSLCSELGPHVSS